MPRCINCWIAIPITQQHRYNAADMDVEIVSILEEWIARQVIDEDYLCQECFNLLIVESNNRIEGNIGERQLGHDSVCVCCGISIARRTGRRSYELNNGDAAWTYSANIISPLEMPANARACNACWQRAQRQPPSPAENASSADICGYYCSCIVGKRTIGSCAHVMTIVWYLGWARHQNNILPPAQFLDDVILREDIENEDIE